MGANAQQALVRIEQHGLLVKRGQLVGRDDQGTVRHRAVAQEPPHRNGTDLFLRGVHPFEVHDGVVGLASKIRTVMDLNDKVGAGRHGNAPAVRVPGRKRPRLPRVDVGRVGGPPRSTVEPWQGVCGIERRRRPRRVHKNVGVVHRGGKARKDLDRLNVPGFFEVRGYHKPPVLLVVGLQRVRFKIRHEVHALEQRPLRPKLRDLHLHGFVPVRHPGVVPLFKQRHVLVAQHILSHKMLVARIGGPRGHLTVLHYMHVHVGREKHVLVGEEWKRSWTAVVVALRAMRVHDGRDVVHPRGQLGMSHKARPQDQPPKTQETNRR